MRSTSSLGLLTVVLAATALGVAVFAATRAPTSAVAECDHGELEAELGRLRTRLEVAERNAARGVVRRFADVASDSPSEAPPAAELPTGEPPPAIAAVDPLRGGPRFKRFEAPAALRISQLEDGAIAVENSDPSLTNEILTVVAETENGEQQEMTIVVPAPP